MTGKPGKAGNPWISGHQECLLHPGEEKGNQRVTDAESLRHRVVSYDLYCVIFKLFRTEFNGRFTFVSQTLGQHIVGAL